ncbi:deoxyribose-phosphate aldolase [Phosphitispora fastidiosa]|uniref:deoxyribose-phosphate aldolase n=1 Tax=Phosphitispora fastidiosa TaxID=2837202 RepID=UPI001E619F9B|nr:deoxyribose-phosphate aldolase [Phosphitispora fastidiosa]MBU7005876.1 deoxyribose-phosphate aldolase [Phosphitispora fastidiosa]
MAAEDFSISPGEMARYIDHTILRPDATTADIRKLCEEAAHYGFAAVCVNPIFVGAAVKLLVGTGVKVCTVAGFPLGACTTGMKAWEAAAAANEGAHEIDMVIGIGMLKEKRYEAVGSDISEVVRAVRRVNPQGILKVIIETCLLDNEEKVKACRIAEAAGANFVKTSTGFASGGALSEDVALMRRSVGRSVGVKAAGGIRSAVQAMDMIKAGAARVGTSSGVLIMKELEWE